MLVCVYNIFMYKYIYIPWKSKDYFLNVFSVKTIVFVGIYNQQFKGTDFFLWSLTSRVYIYICLYDMPIYTTICGELVSKREDAKSTSFLVGSGLCCQVNSQRTNESQ